MYVITDGTKTLVVEPEYDFSDRSEVSKVEHRTLDGSLFTYRYGDFYQCKFGVSYVNCEFKTVVNSWWAQGKTLQFYSHVNCTDVRTVVLVNRRTPIDQFVKPYYDLFEGSIELSTF